MGNYTIEGNLFAYDDEHVVIDRGDGDLGMFGIESLSEEDREYLRSKEAPNARESTSMKNSPGN